MRLGGGFWREGVPGLVALTLCLRSAAAHVVDQGTQSERAECADWAAAGECERNPGFMLEGCARACSRGAERSECAEWAAAGECRSVVLLGQPAGRGKSTPTLALHLAVPTSRHRPPLPC